MSGTGLKFGTRIMGVALRELAAVAVHFEECGFESVWIQEHLVFPAELPATYPYSNDGLAPVDAETPLYDPWAVLAHIAAVTTRIRLGTNVYILPLRHPLQTARSVVTLDRLSGGRVVLGVGVGWLEEEFDLMGMAFATRGARADATITALRRLWSDDVVEVSNEHFQFGPVRFRPRPLHPGGIPIEVGGASPAALARAGRLGDGWIEIGCADLDEFRTKLAVVMSARKAAAREATPFEVSVQAGRDWALDDYRRAAEAGATRVIVGPPAGPDGRLTAAGCVDWARRFAEEVIDAAG
jgi:probable F420-dependent oxidoreductase